MPRSAALIGYALIALASAARVRAQTPNPLAAIVGTWQSDTTGGASARSSCAWSPQHRGVICEQTITTPQGTRSAVNVFLPDTTHHRFVYYGIVEPGVPAAPTALTIQGLVWTYGGLTRAADSLFHHTINDFSAGTSYVWRQESSSDSLHWTVQRQGRAVRER